MQLEPNPSFCALPDELLGKIFLMSSFNGLSTLRLSCRQFEKFISINKYFTVALDNWIATPSLPYYTIQANALQLYAHPCRIMHADDNKFILKKRGGLFLTEVERTKLTEAVQETLKEIIRVNNGPEGSKGTHRRIYVWSSRVYSKTPMPVDHIVETINKNEVYKCDNLIQGLLNRIEKMKGTYLHHKGWIFDDKRILWEKSLWNFALYTPDNFSYSNQKPFPPATLDSLNVT